MKLFSLILAILTALLFCACTPSASESQPSEPTAPIETAQPIETTLQPETPVPPETSVPTESAEDFSEYYELLSLSSSERNWINASLGCIFEKPEDIDLYYMFYLGTEGGGWKDICAASEQSLIDQGFMREFDLQLMPAADLETILQSTFGISLSAVTIPEEWGYIEEENAYCSNHSDAYLVWPSAITDVQETDDGTVAISYTINAYYNPQTDEFMDTANLVLTLYKTEQGGWLVRSNVIAE